MASSSATTSPTSEQQPGKQPKLYDFLAHDTQWIKDMFPPEQPIRSFEELQAVIQEIIGLTSSNFDTLENAINQFEGFMVRTTDDLGWSFYETLLPKIIEWSLESQYHKKIPLLSAGKQRSVTLSQKEARFLLAHAFFHNLKSIEYEKDEKNKKYGTLSLFCLYKQNVSVGVERIKCLLAYFALAHHASDEQTIVFERLALTPENEPKWGELNIPIDTKNVLIHMKRMEDVEADAFVDFANKDLHIHEIIPSATQEEVLFSCCPEAFPGILFCERLRDNEAIVIKGCRRFLDYTGYLFKFALKNIFDPPLPAQDIIVIDAVFHSHFSTDHINRDLNKAYLGFLACRGKSVATGHWGCGAFGGDKVHKFIQQLCAATAAEGKSDNSHNNNNNNHNNNHNNNNNNNSNNNNNNNNNAVALKYSTFLDEKTALLFKSFLQSIEKRGATIADLYKFMIEYNTITAKRPSFTDFLSGKLK